MFGRVALCIYKHQSYAGTAEPLRGNDKFSRLILLFEKRYSAFEIYLIEDFFLFGIQYYCQHQNI